MAENIIHIEVKGEITLKIPEFRAALQESVRETVELGEQHLGDETSGLLRPRPGGVYLSVAEAQKGKASVGNYRSNMHTRVTNLHGLITDGGVEYGPWLEGTGSRNQTTRFKGYHSFRRTAQWLQEKAPAVLQKNIQAVIQGMERDK